MSRLRVVSDTSPVSALVAMGWLDWLRIRWEEVHVPEMVWEELRRRSMPRDWESLEDARRQGWLHVMAVGNPEVVEELSRMDLHPGECEAIALAEELGAGCLLMDERDGRLVAEHRGLKFTGTAGMILWAKLQNLIPSARDAMLNLRSQARFFHDDDLIESIAEQSGESGEAGT